MPVILLFFLLCRSSLVAQEEGFATPTEQGIEDLEFSMDMEQYFKEELAFPEEEVVSSTIKRSLAAKLSIETSHEPAGVWKVVFTFPEPVVVEEKVSERSLLLRFNQSIDTPDLAKAEEPLAFLIKTASNGYNTLYLEGERNIQFHTQVSGAVFTLILQPDYTQQIPATTALKTAYARLLIEERHYSKALCALSSITKENPCDKGARQLFASAEGLIPLWKRQKQSYDTLERQFPHDADLRLLAAEAYLPHTPYLQFEAQLQDTLNQASIWVLPWQGEAVLYDNPRATLFGGMQYQLWEGKVDSLVNSQGDLVPFRGKRNQGTIYLRDETDTGSRFRGSLYIQEGSVVGAGTEMSWLWPFVQGEITFTADWHRPYWEVYETFAYHGREDRVKLGMNSTINRYVSYDLGAGTRRVGIQGTPTGFTSILANAEIFYFWSIRNPNIAFNYSYNAEYVLYQAVKTGTSGQLYNPVPYQSFEDHTLLAYVFYQFRRHWYFTLFGGETFNRLGLNSPTSGVSARYMKPTPNGWELDLSVYQFPNTAAGSSLAIFYTAILRARF